MTDEPEGPERRLALVESDRFEADWDRVLLSVNRSLGPERANEWAVGLSRAISALPEFPGPRSHAQDEEASALYGQEVRRLLYYGPHRTRRSAKPLRLLFSILPPDPEEPPETAESVLFLLRLLSAGQVLQPDDPSE